MPNTMPCPGGCCETRPLTAAALLVLTKIYMCSMNDVSKRERKRGSGIAMKSVLGKLCKSENQKLSRGLDWGSFWGMIQVSVVTIFFSLEVQLVVSWV